MFYIGLWERSHRQEAQLTLHHSSPAVLNAAPECAAERLLPAVPTSVRDARSMVRRELSLWGADDLIDDCVLVVSELVTNAVRHGGAACALRISGSGRHVYGELFDPGAGTPAVCEAARRLPAAGDCRSSTPSPTTGASPGPRGRQGRLVHHRPPRSAPVPRAQAGPGVPVKPSRS